MLGVSRAVGGHNKMRQNPFTCFCHLPNFNFSMACFPISFQLYNWTWGTTNPTSYTKLQCNKLVIFLHLFHSLSKTFRLSGDYINRRMNVKFETRLWLTDTSIAIRDMWDTCNQREFLLITNDAFKWMDLDQANCQQINPFEEIKTD